MMLRRLLAALILAAAWPAAAHAQDANVQELRLRKLEAEVRALQRQVFPGPQGAIGGEPAAAGPLTPPASQPGTPATSPVTDLLTRVDALEAQNARLTAQNEEMANRLRQIEGKLSAAPPPVVVAPVVVAAPAPRPTALVAEPPAAAPPAARPSPSRVAGVKAVVKPDTGDAAEDDYTYGFKLWQAKFYPEAEQQLKLFLDKYPKSPRISFARNLLGRAFFDDGKPRDAAPWFLQNYQSDKKGARAPDSLLYLAKSMIVLKDTTRACIALGEFADTYPSDAAGRLKAPYAEAKAGVTCS